MIRINLLAADRPSQKKKAAGGTPGAFQAYLIVGLLAGGALAVCAALYFLKAAEIAELESKIQTEEATKARLQSVKQQVDALQAKEAALQKRLKLLEELRAQQGAAVRMIDEVSKALPEFVWLQALERAGPQVRIVGQSATNPAVADFMTNLQRSGFFPVVDLGQTLEQQNVVNFNLTATFQPPAPPAASPAPGAAAPAAPAPGR